MAMFLHVFGHPNLPLNLEEFPEDAQVQTCWRFCELLEHLHLPYLYYGLTGSVVPGQSGSVVPLGKATGLWGWGNGWHRLYTKRLTRALARNRHSEAEELVASLYGAAHCQVELGGLPALEPMVGYNHCWAPWRVFPSYAQQNVIYATRLQETWQTRANDAVIPHFLNPEEFALADAPGDYLLYLGRDAPDKGIDIARKCADLAQVPLRIEHRGWHGAAKAELLAKARAVLCPTWYPEPFGYVAAEAMMCGTPVLATDWGAFPEFVLPGKNGFLCRTPEEFAQAVPLLSRLDRSAIRRFAIRHFGIAHIAPKYLAFFRKIQLSIDSSPQEDR